LTLSEHITQLPGRVSFKGKLPLPILLYVLAVAIPFRFDVGPLTLNGVRAILLVTIIPLTIRLMMGKYGKVLLTDIMLFLHMFWALLALWVNNPLRVVETIGSTSIEFLGGYVLARAYIRSSESFGALCRFVIFVVCCTLPFALYETLTGRPILIELINNLPGLRSENNVNQEPRLGLERAQVVFAHPIHYGLFCSMAFSLSFVGFKGIYNSTKRYLLCIIITLCVFFSVSSGALLAVMLQLGIIFWAWTFQRISFRWLLLLGFLVFCYVTIDLLSNRTPMRVFMTYATFSPWNAYWRGLIFEHGMNNVWANPFLGLGLNNWIRPSFMAGSSVDNFWLLTAMQFGIPGFILLSGGYAIALWHVGRRPLDDYPLLWQQRRAWMFTLAGLTFTLATVAIWSSIYSFVFFFFGAGMWFITTEPKTETKIATSKTDRGGPSLRRSDRSNALKRTRQKPTSEDTDQPIVDTGRDQISDRTDRNLTRYTRFPSTDDKPEDQESS